MTKKRSSEILGVKMEIFSGKNCNSEILVRENFFPSPQTRRQVSAAGLMNACLYIGLLSLFLNFCSLEIPAIFHSQLFSVVRILFSSCFHMAQTSGPFGNIGCIIASVFLPDLFYET